MAARCVRVGIDENVAVIEGGEEPYFARQQHAVAKDIAGHVADADDGEGLRLDVDTELAKVPLDGFPGAACGDAHLLVVVANRSAGGEGIAKPEVVFDGDGVGDVREGCGPLVGGDHQVGIVAITAAHAGGGLHPAVDPIVSQVEQAPDEGRIAGNALGQPCLPLTGRRQPLADEAALRAERHDHRVLDHLRLDQAQHLAAEVFHAIRPAQTATGDAGATQVHALDPLAVDEDLVQRGWRRQEGYLARGKLERQIALRRTILCRLVGVGAQRRRDGRLQGRENPVVVRIADLQQRHRQFVTQRSGAGIVGRYRASRASD
ncbi:MAG: hypothetical protein AW12_00215 [Candidatus Accumulibacter sp. BA-94]|nr:MAG: hypothetical protein AW12_00215 [Candidatus Accumulibacter sp. BA-94]